MLKQIAFFLMLFAMFMANAVDEPSAWKPRDWSAFYFTPGKRSVFRLAHPSAKAGTRIKYEIRDYADRIVDHGESIVSGNHSLGIPFRLPKGYYEITLIGQNRKIGLWGAHPFTRKPDPFFGIDAGYSWFPGGEKESAMMNALHTYGIHTVRERLSYREIQEDLDTGRGWTEGHGKRYLGVRQRLNACGLRVMDCFHDAPASRGGDPTAWNSSNYPVNLVSVAKDWKSIFPHLNGLDESMEIWNEPDGFSIGPATLYVPLVKTLAWSYAESGAKMLLVGGVFSELAPPDFLESAAGDGLFDYVDAVSFHTYSGPVEVEKQIRGYRDLFKKYKREGMPLFITEAGRPFSHEAWWEQGNAASWIIAKGVVARACGLAGYYPFFAQSFAQAEMNFSMLHTDSSPRRSMAAYLNMVSELSNLEYVGDLEFNDPKLIACPVFGDGTRMVAVPVSLSVQGENTIALHAPVTAIRGIDGRQLSLTTDKRIPIPDGVAYLDLNPQQMKTAFAKNLKKDTPYMELYQRAKIPLSAKKVTPVVLSFAPEAGDVSCKGRRLDGFHIEKNRIPNFHFKVNAFNLSGKGVRGKLVVVPPAGGSFEDETIRPLEIPAQSSVQEAFTLNLSKCPGAADQVAIRFEEENGAGDTLAPVLIWNAEQKSCRIPSRGSRIQIDGIVTPEEWGKTEPLVLGNADFGVSARFAWGPKGFYFAFEVRDSKHLQRCGAGTAWQEDCIQMAFADAGAQYEYGIFLADDGPCWSRWIAPDGTGPLRKNAPLCIVRDDSRNMTTYEGMLPWDAVAPIKGVPNSSFRFTFCVHNLSENGEKQMIEWTPGISSSGKNPDLFGVIQLYDNME